MKAHDVMTREVVSVMPDATVAEVAQIITERRIGGVPVVDEGGQVIGIINKRELFLREQGVPFSTERLPSLFNRFITPSDLPEKYRELRNVRAEEVMNRAVVAVEVNDDIGHVAETMMRSRVRRVPVTQEGRLVGIISRSDIIHLMVEGEGVLAEAGE